MTKFHIGFALGFAGFGYVGLAAYREYRQPPKLAKLEPVKGSEWQKLRTLLHNEWKILSPGKKTCASILSLNAAVFLAWKIPRWRGFMNRHFVHVPGSGRAHTLLTSAFSHQSGLHLLFNSMAMYSFWPLLQDSRGFSSEQMIAFYLLGGLSASMVSHSYALMRGNLMTGSLGASGGVWSLVAMTAFYYPQLKVGVLFLPIHFPLQVAVPTLLFFDIVGLLRQWRTFDHAAHLGGAAFGALYAIYGPSMWMKLRKQLKSK